MRRHPVAFLALVMVIFIAIIMMTLVLEVPMRRHPGAFLILFMLISIVIIVLALVLGCGQPASGTVIERQFVPAHTTSNTHCDYRNVGPGGKTQYYCAPILQYYGDDFELKLRQPDGSSGWRNVTEAEYNAYAVGDSYPRRH